MVAQIEKSQKCKWMEGWLLTNWKKGISSWVCTSVIKEKIVENAFR